MAKQGRDTVSAPPLDEVSGSVLGAYLKVPLEPKEPAKKKTAK